MTDDERLGEQSENTEIPEPAPNSDPLSHEISSPQLPSKETPQNTSDPSINSSQAIELSLEAGNVDNSLYYIKWMKFNDSDCPIITQNENGPCPLIAIMNVLLLRKLLKLEESLEYTTTTNLMKHIGHHLMNRVPKDFKSEEEKLNYEQNVADAFQVICKLQSGIDVNIGFASVTSYELTPEIVIFDLLGIKLYHGWLIDPQDESLFKVLGSITYNKAVELALDENNVQSYAVKDFLETTSNQLTYHGLFELTAALQEAEVSVLFRNNHFSTITKRDGVLYQLVTDQGFVKEDSVVWEAMSSVSGDTEFVNSFFKKTSHLRSHEPVENYSASSNQNGEPKTDDLKDNDPDYQLALQLETSDLCLNDAEIARRLQEAENSAREDERRSSRVVATNSNQTNSGANRNRRTSSCNSSDGSTCTIL